MTRKEKKREKARRAADWRCRRWDRCARALDVIGLGDGFRELKDRTKDFLAAVCRPLPEFHTESLGPNCSQLKAEILEELAESVVSIGDTVIPWPEAYAVLSPLTDELSYTVVEARHAADSDFRYLDRARRVCAEHAGGIAADTFHILGDVTIRAAAGASDFDRWIVWLRLEGPLSAGKRCHRIEFKSELSQRSEAKLDGATRPVYRCGGGWGKDGFRWVSWPGEILGTSGPSEGYPVYIQRHALDRLGERLQPLGHDTVQFSLHWSLDNPAIIRCRDDDTYLIEYRLGNNVLAGYLTARRLCDKVVITTFLFLTMQGTPEARRLAERLRLRRPDMEHNGLDRLAGFINTDLARDPDLAQVFKESGCQGLLEIACEEFSTRPVKAAGLRAYLGLAKQPLLTSGPSGAAATPAPAACHHAPHRRTVICS